MVQGVNLEEVRKYNESLKQYRDKASQLKAEIDYNNKEIDTLCAELTTELGMQVTRENVVQVYNEQVIRLIQHYSQVMQYYLRLLAKKVLQVEIQLCLYKMQYLSRLLVSQ